MDTLPDFPALQPSNRGREFNQYSSEEHIEVVYHYLFSGMSHRALDRVVLGLDPLVSKGYQSMGILHFLGLVGKHKHFFEGLSLDKALAILKPYAQSESYMLLFSYLREKAEEGPMGDEDGYAVAELDAKYWVSQFLKDVEDPQQIESRLSKIPTSSQEFRFGKYKYFISSPSLKETLKCTYDFYCQVCHTRIYRPKWVSTLSKKEQWKHLNADVHHIRPLSKGGEDLQQNMLCLCPNCHRRFHTEEQVLKQGKSQIYTFNQITGESTPLAKKHTIVLG
ncbi:HNH endonuclease [Sphaerochaeta sp. PS]|uniref:HNH endonuclease signature motif containing protein n=1 Tax=Sphaerochaeta sp. PS TaxID=3076336 RepID=UPI0028A475A6|nr:HNH endonuclease [Sphaerochaeta sp. PS]MDT4762512.1 HNH endonuclease [Sphaerochaeta sp. PS]